MGCVKQNKKGWQEDKNPKEQNRKDDTEKTVLDILSLFYILLPKLRQCQNMLQQMNLHKHRYCL